MFTWGDTLVPSRGIATLPLLVGLVHNNVFLCCHRKVYNTLPLHLRRDMTVKESDYPNDLVTCSRVVYNLVIKSLEPSFCLSLLFGFSMLHHSIIYFLSFWV